MDSCGCVAPQPVSQQPDHGLQSLRHMLGATAHAPSGHAHSDLHPAPFGRMQLAKLVCTGRARAVLSQSSVIVI